MPDPDEKIGVGHAFIKKFEKPKNPTVLEKNNQPADSELRLETQPRSQPSTATPTDDDVFSWGASLGTVSSASTGRSYFGDRTLPPELANPEAHPSPFGDTIKKGYFMPDLRLNTP